MMSPMTLKPNLRMQLSANDTSSMKLKSVDTRYMPSGARNMFRSGYLASRAGMFCRFGLEQEVLPVRTMELKCGCTLPSDEMYSGFR